MAKISYSVHDLFKFENGYGLVLADNLAFIIEGSGGRSGYTMKKGPIPENTQPIVKDRFAFPAEVQLAFDAVICVNSQETSTADASE